MGWLVGGIDRQSRLPPLENGHSPILPSFSRYIRPPEQKRTPHQSGVVFLYNPIRSYAPKSALAELGSATGVGARRTARPLTRWRPPEYGANAPYSHSSEDTSAARPQRKRPHQIGVVFCVYSRLCRRANISAWRTEVHDEQLSDRTSYAPSYEDRGSGNRPSSG